MAQLVEDAQMVNAGGPALLLVDADAEHREDYARRLERRGYTVGIAADADEAVEAVKRATPDAVVLDIAMPGRDGLSLLQELIAIEPALPVIIHTAYTAYRDNFIAWAADAYIEKSTDPGPLTAAIEQAVTRSRVA